MRQRGVSLIEMMLAITVLLGAALGVYVIAARAQVNASIQREQKQLDAVVEVVQGQFMAAADFTGLTTDQVIRSGRLDIRSTDGALASGFGSPATVRPSTTIDANDSFDVVYEELTTAQCVRLVPALYLKSSDVLVGSPQESVQQTVGAETGRLVDEDILLDACAQPEFERGDGVVAFRFFHPRNTHSTPAAGMGCTCADQQEDQLIGCPAGQAGSIQQRRNGTCTGGTPACPSLEWSAWATTNDTCAPVVTPPAPPPVVTPPSQTCFPSAITRLVPCTAPMTGQITEQMTTTCATPTSVPVVGAWTVIASSCTAPTTTAATCTPSTETRHQVCPGGQGGNITEQRSSTCPGATGAPVWGGWVETSRTCTASCIASGTCCVPQPDQTRTRRDDCPAGTFGGPVFTDEERSSYCANATAAVAWVAWYAVNTSGSCTTCPGSSTETRHQWESVTEACASGFSGSVSYQREQVSTRSVSYNCPTGTTSLPAPTRGAWSAWSNTGATLNYSNTCAANCVVPAPESRWLTSTSSCPSGGTQSIEYREQRTASCPSSTGSPVWGAWADTGDRRNYVGCPSPTCTAPASTSMAISRSLADENQNVGCGGSDPGDRWMRRSVTQNGTRTTSWACPGPTSTVSDVWGSLNYGAWYETSNTCVASTCTGNSSESQWLPTNGTCSAGSWGTPNWEREQTRSRTCTSGTWGSWGAWTDTGATRNPASPCTSCGSTSGTQVVWQARSQACPTGQTGSHTWEEQRNQSRTGTYNCPAGTTSLPAPTWGAWADGSWTGTTRNVVNTCAAPARPDCGVTPVEPTPICSYVVYMGAATSAANCSAGNYNWTLSSSTGYWCHLHIHIDPGYICNYVTSTACPTP